MTAVDVYYLPQKNRPSDLLLRTAASRFTGLAPEEFDTVREYGKKPTFRIHPELFASVSHSDGVWACALTYEGPVGLDIQLKRCMPRRDGIARRYFHPDEAEAVRSAGDPDAAFSRIWCRKEASVKLSGRGIDGEFASFNTASPDPVTVFGSPLYLTDFSLPGYADLYASAAFGKPFAVRLSALSFESE